VEKFKNKLLTLIYMWQEEVEIKYDELLPYWSKGRDADNPEWFHHFFTDSHKSFWPFLTLCKDENGLITWHNACDEHSLDGFLNGEHDKDISADRRRPLRVIELYIRSEKDYIILPEKEYIILE